MRPTKAPFACPPCREFHEWWQTTTPMVLKVKSCLAIEENFIRLVFDKVDSDGSGMLDEFEVREIGTCTPGGHMRTIYALYAHHMHPGRPRPPSLLTLQGVALILFYDYKGMPSLPSTITRE